MANSKILCFAGSIREKSYNRALLQHFAAMLSENFDIDILDLKEYDIPLYNADFEATLGFPEHVNILKNRFANSQGFIIASPEYNGFFTPLLKNLLDWVSRPTRDNPPAAVFRNKKAILISTSPGTGGGCRSLIHTRKLLENLGVLVMQQTLGIPSAQNVFDEKGNLINTAVEQRLALFATKASYYLKY